MAGPGAFSTSEEKKVENAGCLRGQFAADLGIFFDLGELAACHEFAGRRLVVVLDSDQAMGNSLKAPGGTYEGDLLLFAQSRDLWGLAVQPGKLTTLDGRPVQVEQVVESEGVTQVTLVSHRGV